MIPKPLLNAIRKKECFPIIGAGFSLNAKLETGTMPTWKELTKKLSEAGDIDEQDPLQTAQKFEDTTDRTRLINTIAELLHYDKVKPHHVHRHFVQIPYFDIICTTNYDNLLEDACKQEGKTARVIVEKEHISMYANSSDLKILKIHADFTHPDKLTITQNDYSRYSENHPQIELYLSNLLMTKTPIFIGFSLEDPNFLQIKEKIDSLMGESVHKGYIILVDPNEEKIKTYENMKLKVIPIETNDKTISECLLELFENIHSQPTKDKDIENTAIEETQLESGKSIEEIQNLDEKDQTISVSANKTVLFKNQTLLIRTITRQETTKPISIYIKNENNDIIYNTDTNNAKHVNQLVFEKEVVLKNEIWEEGKDYTIFAELDGQKTSDSFTLSQPPEIVVQTDKSVYIRGSDIILTGIVSQASIGSNIDYKILNESKEIVKHGTMPIENEDTGIFQAVVNFEIDRFGYRGEEYTIIIEYQDKSDSVSIFSSNFGAIVELDQKVYTWTDRAYITIVAPDFSQRGTIGEEKDGQITIKTRLGEITKYKLKEVTKDSGIFTGEIILSGFVGKEVQSKVARKYPVGITRGQGPNDGLIACNEDDGITVSFEFSEDEIVVGSALIRWNTGEVQWLEENYHINDYAIVRVIDPDVGLSPKEIDIFDIHVWSDSDKKGIKIPVYETGNETGIFEGLVSFGIKSLPNKGILGAREGDTVYAEYIDVTLPDPYRIDDELAISSTTKIIL